MLGVGYAVDSLGHLVSVGASILGIYGDVDEYGVYMEV